MMVLSSITNVLMGGAKLVTIAKTPFGSRVIGNHSNHGIIIVIITGIISDCASVISFTADPIAAIHEPSVKYAIRLEAAEGILGRATHVYRPRKR